MQIYLCNGPALPNCKAPYIATLFDRRHQKNRMSGQNFLFFICFMLLSIGIARSQSPEREAVNNSSIKPLKIGDKIPDELWNLPLQVVNHSDGKETITLSEYNDKLIILDFWATWCGSCISNFPKLNTFQNNHNGQVKVFLVNTKSTKDTFEKVKKFLSNRTEIINLASVVEDTLLTKLFPHRSIPHYVWVKEGRLLAISHAEDLTSQNIKNAFIGKEIATSYITPIEYDMRKPLFENGNGGEAPKYIFKSFLAPYVNGLKSSISRYRDSSQLISRITFTNISLLALYTYAYPELQKFSRARLILNVKDTLPFDTDNTTISWKNQNLYNYEIQLTPSPKKKVQQIVKQDLQRFFGYQVRLEVRVINCWVVRAIDNPLAINFPKNIHSETNLYDNGGSEIYLNNCPLSDLLTKLESLHGEPFLNETNIKVPVKLQLPSNLKEMSALKKSLASQGILISKESRELPVIILSDH